MTSTLFNLALGVALICLTNLSLISTTKAGFDILSDETPLILTPYIDANQTELAKALSSVSRLPSTNGPDIIGYSGYLTVNETCNGNLYFFFTPNSNQSKPILLWLQGGPGAASTFGYLIENGGLQLVNKSYVQPREHAWTNEFHLLYIDSPIQTGYSFADDDACLSHDEKSVSSNLYEALKQFFTLFSEYKTNPFFLTGESYAGKYVPALGYRIHKDLPNSRNYFNFIGIAIGNALIDPINQIDYADHLHIGGLLDANEADKVRKTTNKIKKLIEHEKYEEAAELFIPLVFNSDNHSMLYNYTGQTFHYNVLIDSDPQVIDDYNVYMQDDDVRRALHVYPINFKTGDKVGQGMKKDILKTIKNEFITLAENYPTILYNGQLDIIIPPIFTENFLNKLDWKYSSKFYKAKREIWRLADEPLKVAGFKKHVGKFAFVVIKRAGHMVPWDQPKVTLELIKNFVNESI